MNYFLGVTMVSIFAAPWIIAAINELQGVAHTLSNIALVVPLQ